jgi:hypothetical protein
MCLPLSRLNLNGILPLLAEADPGVYIAGATDPSVASLSNIRYFAKNAAGIPNGRLPFIYSCQTIHQEDKHMTRADLEINQQDMWRTLVFEQRTTLTLAVEMLLRCQLSPEQILTKTAMALEGSHYDS